MKIKIDTKTLSPNEAFALIEMLNCIFGEHEQTFCVEEIESKFIPEPSEVIDGVTVDSQGIPWDARIHSESKALVSDGTWRKRRGIAPDLINSVTAELTGVMNLPASPHTDPEPLTFLELTAKIGELLTTKRADILKINETAAKLGLPNFQSLSARPDLIPDFCTKLGI